jgi:tetratricopeptide (TPR) repeat protein
MLTVSQALALAVQQHQAGQLPQAEQLYQAILQVQPQQADALHLLGVLASQRGQHEQARAYLGQALRVKPDYAAAHNNLGNLLQEQGQLAEAQACYQQALRHKPDYGKAHNNLGRVLHQQGQLAEAQACYERALRHQPDLAEAHNNLGNLLHQHGQLAQARDCYRQALRLKPDLVEAHHNLGNIFQQQGQLAEAQASYQQALRLEPGYAEAHNNLGHLLREQGQLAEALACYRQALRHKPDYAEAYNNLGNVLQEQGQLAEAQACYQQAVRLKPEYAAAHSNLGVALVGQGQLAEALACYEQSLRLQPNYAEAHWNRAHAWLLGGNYEQGWPEYEWRCQVKAFAPPRFPQPLWDGSPLHGQTILLYAEYGLGDTLQFIRYAALVHERGGSVLVACQPPLVSLLSRCPGIERVLSQEDPLPHFDVYAPLLSLPRILGTSLATVPAQVPYLFADAKRIDHWRQELNPVNAFRIGIAWDADPRFRRLNQNRCIPLAEFAPLGRLEGVRLFSLQKGPGIEQIRSVAGLFPVTDLSSRLETFEDTTAVMHNLDLVVSADIVVAHLAGALGVPVWVGVALPFASDWRWLLKREDSPWYPSMRLFRQQEQGHWADVFARMAAALQQRLAQGSGAPIDSSPGEGG